MSVFFFFLLPALGASLPPATGTGVRIKRQDAFITMGEKQDIQIRRTTAGFLNIAAAKINFDGVVTIKGAPIGSGGSNVGARVTALENRLAALGLGKNVERINVVCKAGWQGNGCDKPCTNAGNHEFYSSVGCATSKCTSDLKIGFRYAARTQHSSTKPTIDFGCKQVACTNKNSRQVYIAGTTQNGGTKCNTKTCATSTYISKNKCVPCPSAYTCDGTAKPPKKMLMVKDVNTFCKQFGGKGLSSSTFNDQKLLGYFFLARRVQKGTSWHPVNDNLRGTAKYGTPPTNPTSGPTGTLQWNFKEVQYFLFSTGDFSEWMIIRRSILDSQFGGPTAKEILCSSDYNTPKSYNQYFRGSSEDPWLSYKHHGTSTMMYGENSYGGHSENVLKGGMNVWIYPPSAAT